MKRLFIYVLLVIFSVILLTGCNFDEKLSEESQTIETLPVEEELPQVTIMMGLYGNTQNGNMPAFKDQVDEMLDKLNKKAQDDGLNVIVKIQWLPATYSVDFINQHKDYQCDIYHAWSNAAKVLYEQGYILQLNDLIKNYFPSYYSILKSDHFENFYKIYFDDLETEPIYSLYNNYLNTDAISVMMDKTIVDKYDIKISNLNDYIEALREIKAGGEPKIPGIAYHGFLISDFMKQSGYYNFDYDNLLFYCKYDASDYTVYAASQLDEFNQAIEFYKDLWNEKLIGPYNDPYISLAMGDTYSILTSQSNFLTHKNTFRKDKEYVLFPLNKDKQTQNIHGVGLVVSKDTPNPDRVMMFLNWLYSDQENLDIWNYGGFADDSNQYYGLDDQGRLIYKKIDSPFYYWLDVSARDTVFNIRYARGPHYLAKTYINDYMDLLGEQLKERSIITLIQNISDSTGYEDFWNEYSKLINNIRSYSNLINDVIQIRTNPNFDLSQYIKKLREAGIEDTARSLSKLFNDAAKNQ